MKNRQKSIRFPQAHQLRRMLGLNPGKLPKDERWFTYKGLKFCLLSSEEAKLVKGTRPHRLLVECNVCSMVVSAGRFNQHQAIHPRESLSELSKEWLADGN